MRAAKEIWPARDPQYLAWIAQQPCMLCQKLNQRQTSRTEAAHVGDRGLAQKCPDRQAIPLCGEHHRTGRGAHHLLGKHFWTFWKILREAAMAHYQNLYREETL